MKSIITTIFLITFFTFSSQAASIFCIGPNQWKLVNGNTSTTGSGSCDSSKISSRFACVGSTFYEFTSESSYSSSSPVNCENAVITEMYACVGKTLVVVESSSSYSSHSPVDCSKY